MTKEVLSQRLEEINKAIEQTVASYNSLQGRRDEVLNLIKLVDEAQPQVVDAQVVESAE